MPHNPQNCHWSVLTLLMPPPYWLSATDAPWCCWNDRGVAPLASTAVCEHCPLWQPRRVEHGASAALPPAGAVHLPRAN